MTWSFSRRYSLGGGSFLFRLCRVNYTPAATNISELANTLFNIALATGNIEYMIRARDLYESLNFVREANMAKEYYAFHALAQDKPSEALEIIESCSQEFQNIGDFPSSVHTLSRSAIICITNNRFDDAERYLNKAGLIMENDFDKKHSLVSEFYKATSLLHFHKKNYKAAISNAKISAKICVNMGLNRVATESLKLVAESYHQQGLHEEAYKVSMNMFDLLNTTIGGKIR